MATTDAVTLGRTAFERRAWADAHSQLAAADRDEALAPDDLRRLATAAYLTGRDAESADLWERAHQAFLAAGDVPSAVRCAFWLAWGLLHRGETARGGGWLTRAHRQLAAVEQECAEHGYLLFPIGFQRFMAGDFAGAHAAFSQAARIGEPCGDADLPGDVYCSVIEACQQIFEVHRAKEWTEALTRWCAQQPDLVPYRGQCLVHRSQVCQLHGDWHQAMDEVRQACARLAVPPGQPALGMAWYQQAELQRLRGDFDAAEATYRKASERGHVPQPGRALLRLAQGRLDAAVASIRQALDATGQDRLARARLLPAFAEIMLAARDVSQASDAADELTRLAEDLGAPLLEAAAAQADGAVLLAAHDVEAALVALRRAWTRWWELQAPYETARVRVLIGVACHQVGDDDSAALEWDAARKTFAAVGARPDLRRLDSLAASRLAQNLSGLSNREQEVLALVAAGKTNQEIADELVISPHTVRRHLQNVFTKIDVSSRAAATAYAYQHDLV